ncbi:hypothetical protein H634G_10161 [Metarhizium anisopliae BRIP 53293]|uniref:Uncharacterized protein n=1 Tax=Metarhizium anisopliae BRIP 53293 TaxID=1291518 RepID=A0A0D9NLB2_METAN|nr:hypothetical protein H634G_10161 [Metarhizium anisopliae BRIP 53293]
MSAANRFSPRACVRTREPCQDSGHGATGQLQSIQWNTEHWTSNQGRSTATA